MSKHKPSQPLSLNAALNASQPRQQPDSDSACCGHGRGQHLRYVDHDECSRCECDEFVPAAERQEESRGRIETGVVQFADDWPGVFIRGDNAIAYASELRRIALKLGDSEPVLIELASLLESCKEKP